MASFLFTSHHQYKRVILKINGEHGRVLIILDFAAPRHALISFHLDTKGNPIFTGLG